MGARRWTLDLNKRPRRCWNIAAPGNEHRMRGARWLQARNSNQPTLREIGSIASTRWQTPASLTERIMMEKTISETAPAKGYKGAGMEGFVAAWYARQTAKDMDEFKSLAQRLAGYIKRGHRVLEIAPGPGYLAIELAILTSCRMVGVAVSSTFVRIANENAERAGVDIAFDHGDAADLSLPSNAFDFIVCRAAFKNFARPLAALDEMHRVLKVGGTALIIDLRKDFSPQDINRYVKGKGIINAALIKLTFNTMLKKRAYTQDAMMRLVSQSQFRHGDLCLDSVGFELWLRKTDTDPPVT
jgi:ubiquinone/menaquinone biosynthesis C-methylase UbiE